MAKLKMLQIVSMKLKLQTLNTTDLILFKELLNKSTPNTYLFPCGILLNVQLCVCIVIIVNCSNSIYN